MILRGVQTSAGAIRLRAESGVMNCASSRVRKIRHTRKQLSCSAGMNWLLFAIDMFRGAAYLAKRSSWPFASVVKPASREARTASSTQRRNGPRVRSPIVARIHPLNFHCSGSQLQLRSTSAGHHVADFGARLAVVKALASLDPLCAAGLDDDFGRAHGWLLRDGRCELRYSAGWQCADERPRRAAG